MHQVNPHHLFRPETRAKLIDFVDSGDHLTDDVWNAAENDEKDLFEDDEPIEPQLPRSPHRMSNGTPSKHSDLRRQVANKSMVNNRSWRY